MSRVEPSIPRISLTWLLVAQVLVILPHLLHLPLWIIGLWLICAGWRVQVFRMRARYPSGPERVVLVLAMGIAVFLSRGSLIGLEAGVLLLVATFILKLVELRSRRDALVLIFLGFFVVVTAYLFDDSLLAALYSLLPVTALLAALIGLQQSGVAVQPKATLKLAAGLLLQAVPLMLLLFMLFPRIGPLWSLPNPNKAYSGLSDSMAPADIAELSRTDGLAFRASFDGTVPERRDLYWRALTMDHFDGRRWSQSRDLIAPGAKWEKRGEKLDYSVVMQPTGRPWMYVLDVGQSDHERVRQMSDFRLQNVRPVVQNLLYRASSWPDAVRDPELAPGMRRLALQLPAQGDPRARAWAEELKASTAGPQALVDTLLQHFNREPYGYTLRPPPVGENSIDDFLFTTRNGFCAHYAGAMTFVLRAAGIPARVVAGYQGGELSGDRSYVSVRQFDAHAWVEYWLPEKGWIAVDPTFQVAPERIELGLEEAVSAEQSFLEESPLSLLRYRNVSWVNGLRMTWDNINYGWQRWVLGYQSEEQLQTLRRWFGELEWRRLVLALVGGGAVLLGVVALLLFRPWQHRRDPQQQLLRRFERLLARQGVRRGTGEGIRAFAVRASQALPVQAAAIQAFASAFEAQRYAGATLAADELRAALRRLRRELPWRRAAS
ncbi:DUF3488 domain-containing transglutaminase family protein [Pseudomonas sp. PDM14]|uniref:transglutaminase TgpA family protein n=1 Tax=Pseudomonas sp. PDM14 TaxID=2769288 RepID=UPI00177C82E8|nr:DUF3488 and transglutaminase-like domain-containing protein [Pseudomonas sp. PDM14]MBD9484170.1 DUF3488 domain-containing transglutaminase family protein [Pseudomonas sp. PDM14]